MRSTGSGLGKRTSYSALGGFLTLDPDALATKSQLLLQGADGNEFPIYRDELPDLIHLLSQAACQEVMDDIVGEPSSDVEILSMECIGEFPKTVELELECGTDGRQFRAEFKLSQIKEMTTR